MPPRSPIDMLEVRGNRFPIDVGDAEMGPFDLHLTERVPRDRVFKGALSYSTYRLKNVDQSFLPRHANGFGDYQKRLKVTLHAPLFNAEEEIAVLNFLTQYKRACDNTGISEGIPLRLFRFNQKGVPLAYFETYHNSHRRGCVRVEDYIQS